MKRFMVFGLILIALASCKNKVTGPSNTPSNDNPLITAGSLLDPLSIDLDNPGSVAEALMAEMAEEDSSLKRLSQSVLNDFAGAERGAIAQLKARSNLPQKTSRAGSKILTSFHKTGESPEGGLGTREMCTRDHRFARESQTEFGYMDQSQHRPGSSSS
jgi:hypothetical protein